MKIQELIKDLKNSQLYAHCPCGEEFPISETFLFDGTTKHYPQEALKIQTQLQKRTR